MAEVVGLVVGLASFGVQLIDSTKKVKALCADIRDAPVELQDTIEGIGIMSEIISLMAPLDSQPYAEGAVLARSIELCQTALNRLCDVTNDLRKHLRASSRIRGRLSVVLKKDSMDRLIGRLEQCKSLLQLAHQLYMGARNMSRFDHQERALEELRNGQMALTKIVSQASPIEERLQSQRRVTAQSESTRSAWEGPRPHNGHEHTGLQRPELSIRLRIPGWTFSRVLQLTLAHVPVGWTASLQLYRIVTWNDPFIQACQSNNLVAVKELLQTGRASICDRESGGDTAIDVAMISGAFDVSRYLYQHGGRPTCRFSVVYSFCTYYPQQVAWNRQITDQPSWDESTRMCIDALEQLGIDHCDDVFQEPSLKPLVTPLKSYSASERLDLMMESVHETCLNHADWIRMWNLLLDIIGDGPLDPALLHGQAYEGRTISHILAEVFANGAMIFEVEAGERHPLLSHMQPLMAECVSLGADMTSKGNWSTPDGLHINSATPLAMLIYTFFVYDEDKMDLKYDLLLRAWVQMLADSGVNLAVYGAAQEATKSKYINRSSALTKILGFAYGSEAANWHFWFLAEYDVYVGDFWKMVEDPQFHIPGAWMEEESDEEDW